MKKLALKLPPPEGNKTEQAFGLKLAADKQAGDILWYAFEPIKLKLARTCFYTPDFGVLFDDWAFGFYEVKGFWRDDARVKIKVAKKLYPFFQFWAVTRHKHGWKFEEF